MCNCIPLYPSKNYILLQNIYDYQEGKKATLVNTIKMAMPTISYIKFNF